MKSKALIAMAVAGAFWSAGSIAGGAGNPMDLSSTGGANHGHAYSGNWPSADVNEAPAAMSTLQSLDTKTGGYKGWGPMANLQTPVSVDEYQPLASIDKERAHQQQLAEVNAARDQVWVANAPLRSEYENIGSTRGQAGGGFGRFFSR